ncbi:MAG TPA: tetratricopeptide repeat protein [Trichocoleus sp.]|jgi:putative thioredoxin
MGVSVEVNSNNFAAEVVQASHDRPVLVDFFAQWCGPCQMLKPILEKLVQEYDFVLAKVDIDQSNDLASTYRIEGVPDVRVFVQGEMHPGFVGVLSEPKIRQFLAQLNLKSQLETGLEEIQQAMAAGDSEQAKGLFAKLIEQYPQDRKLAVAAAQFLIGQNKFDSAEKLLSFIQENEKPYFARAQALRTLIELKRESETTNFGNEFDRPFFTSVQQILTGDYEAALEGFLSIAAKDRKYRNDSARKAMVMAFEIMGDEHPLTPQYRKKLVQVLY